MTDFTGQGLRPFSSKPVMIVSCAVYYIKPHPCILYLRDLPGIQHARPHCHNLKFAFVNAAQSQASDPACFHSAKCHMVTARVPLRRKSSALALPARNRKHTFENSSEQTAQRLWHGGRFARQITGLFRSPCVLKLLHQANDTPIVTTVV